MSKYADFSTCLRDVEHIVGALEELGYRPEVHEEAVPLYDYWGNVTAEKAHVIIRRKQLTASNDIGFERTADGTFRAIVDDHYGEPWLCKVKQAYAVRRTLAIAQQRGYALRRREVVDTSGGKQVRLVFSAR